MGHWGGADLPFLSPQQDTSGPAKAARPRIRGQCIVWYARLLPSFRWYSLTDSEGMAR